MGKTVLFGGTFNPPHLFHEKLIKILCDMQDISSVLLVPTGVPVHKACAQLATPEQRLEMCRIVAAKFKKADVWNVELKRKQKSYTYYTVKEFCETFGEKPGFVCGADMLVTLPTWYNYRKLVKMCELFAVFRTGCDREEFDRLAEKIRLDGGTVNIIECELSPLSSSDVRRMVYKGDNLENAVSKEIEEYIKANRLYLEDSDMTVEEYKEHLQKRLSEKRYFHSLCVAEEAVRLADRYGGDRSKAYLAGLLHDVLKDTDDKEQLKFAKQFGIILSDLELNAPKLYHSIIGSEYIRQVLGVTDPEIISAVKYHTTAKADMTLLEKILYLADYTSRDRDYDGVDKMREAVEQSMEKAMKIALQYTVEDLTSRGLPVHPDTLAAYEQYAK